MEDLCGGEEPSVSDVTFPPRVVAEALGSGQICRGGVGSGSDCSCAAWF